MERRELARSGTLKAQAKAETACARRAEEAGRVRAEEAMQAQAQEEAQQAMPASCPPVAQAVRAFRRLDPILAPCIPALKLIFSYHCRRSGALLRSKRSARLRACAHRKHWMQPLGWVQSALRLAIIPMRPSLCKWLC